MKAKILVLVIALLGMLVPGMPYFIATVPAHAAPTNNLILGYFTGTYPGPSTSGTTVAAKYNVSVYLNNPVVQQIDGVIPTTTYHYFVINFSQITIQAGEVTMYLSTNGYAQISSSDIMLYSLPTSLINASTLSTVTVTAANGQKLTLEVGEKAIIGPLPLVSIPHNLYYVKAYFGTTAPVAVSLAVVNVLPTIYSTPSEGPVGQTVTVNGYAFSPAGTVEVSLTYQTKTIEAVNVTASSSGTFTYTFVAPELSLEFPPPEEQVIPGYLPNGTITISAYDYMSGLSSNTQSYTELGRAFYEIEELNPATNSYQSFIASGKIALNGSPTDINLYETEPMIIAGINFAPDSQVTLKLGSTVLGTVMTNGTGFFNTTVTVPVVARQLYNITASDPYGYIYFSGTPQTEIVVSSASFTPGSTLTIKGYAFAYPSVVNVMFEGLYISSGVAYGYSTLASNVPVSSTGQFTVTVTVPSITFGGYHYIYAVSNVSGVTAYSQVTVLPEIILDPSTVTTASLGSQVTVYLTGLDIGTATGSTGLAPFDTSSYPFGAAAQTYTVAYDNIPTYISGVSGNANGTYTNTIIASGYPQVHYVQLIQSSGDQQVAYATLNVTGTTNTEAATLNAINSLSTQISSLSSTLASDYSSLSSMLSSLSSTISSDYSSMSSMLSGISSSLSTLSSNLASDYSSLSTSLSSISSSLSSLSSSLSSDYSSLNSAISSLSSSVSSVSSSASSISSSVSSISSTVSSLQSTVSSLSTYLIVVAVLAIIIIVLELVILVRKK